MKFCKMNGIGNDYVFLFLPDLIENTEPFPLLAARLSDRHLSVGGDGLVTIDASETADCKMRIFNADGSEAETCGNALRCVAKYVFDKGYVRKNVITVETAAGVKQVRVKSRGSVADILTAEIGNPKVIVPDGLPDELKDGRQFVSVGNPHAVKFCGRITEAEMQGAKRLSETYKGGINAEVAKVLCDGSVIMRVYERGSGETMACGTGAAATAYAARLNGLNRDNITVHLLGGTLTVTFEGETAFVTGRADYNFFGEIPDKSLFPLKT